VSKKEYDFTTGFSHAVAHQLERYDHIREDEKLYRDMKMDILREIKRYLRDETMSRLEKELERGL
jgi:hypothetical protein